jgi:uncharacterized protein (DUF924 family)
MAGILTVAELPILPSSKNILEYWYGSVVPCPGGRMLWFKEKPVLDNAFDALAKIILLDQFTRNAFRDQPASFSEDSSALKLTLSLLETPKLHAEATETFGAYEWAFTLMPFMHSEEMVHQDKGIDILSKLSSTYPQLAMNVKFANDHRDIIKRFGR